MKSLLYILMPLHGMEREADRQASGWNPAYCVEAMVRDVMVSPHGTGDSFDANV